MREKYRKLIALQASRRGILSLAWSCARGARLGLNLAAGRGRLTPLVGTIIPTYRCDSNCPKCAKRSLLAPAQELSTALLKGVIDDFARLGIPALDFSGGEPLLREDLPDLVRHASGHGLLVHLNTNARLVDAEGAMRLLSAGVSSVNVSLDSLVPERAARLTGRADGLDRILAGLDCLLQARRRRGAPVMITLVTVLQPENVGEIEDLIAFGRERGVDAITFNPLHLFPGPEDTVAAREALRTGVELLIALKPREPLLENSAGYLRMLTNYLEGRPLPVRCVAGRSHIVVDACGRVFPCFVWLERGCRGVPLAGRSLHQTVVSAEYRHLLEEAASCRACHWNCHAELSLLYAPCTRLAERLRSGRRARRKG